MHSQNTSLSLKRTKQHIYLSKMQSKLAAPREMKRTEMKEECVWKLIPAMRTYKNEVSRVCENQPIEILEF